MKTLTRARARDLGARLDGWKVGAKELTLELSMKDFPSAIAFVHDVAQLAESEDHHPDLHLTRYRDLKIVLSTHDAGGLTERDFALAAKIDALPRKLKP
jgi:4a-hydroxytetrahydrobiopterin dehydratase